MRSIVIIFLALALLNGGPIFARAYYDDDSRQIHNSAMVAANNLLPDTVEIWPQWIAFHGTNEILSSFNCYGQLGTGFWPPSQYGPSSAIMMGCPSFVTPPQENVEYLFGGGIWVGGIINGDTLVSVGAEGWSLTGEMYPPGKKYPDPTVTRQFYPAENSFHALFYDTIPDSYTLYTHEPMGLRLVLRGHNINNDDYNKTILYDLVVTNISDNAIDKAYIGIFMDADIWAAGLGEAGFNDDFVGSLREYGLAYAYDNDGDPHPGSHEYVDGYSATRVMGLKLIETSFAATDTNFNWWVSNSYPYNDFGARQRGTDDDPFRDFGTLGTGTPEGDKNKYYIMSHKEWDYDFIFARYIEDDDPIWLHTFPPDPPWDFYSCCDSRFLLSVGPVDLLPDSSARVIFSTLTAEQFHIDPDNFGNNFENPRVFLSNLDIEALISSVQMADLLADSLIQPQFPVLGLREVAHGDDTVRIEWDPWVFDDVTGYDIYLSPVPFDMFPYPDALPPWLEPTEFILHDQLGRTYSYLLSGLDPNRYYFVNVANNAGKTIGDPGRTLIVRSGERYPAPEIGSPYIYAPDGQPAVITWTGPEGVDIDHYNIYRVDSTDHSMYQEHAFYSLRRMDNVVDSFQIGDRKYYYYAMQPWANADAGIREMAIDPIDERYRYYITAVDPNGLESEFTEAIYAYHKPAKTRNVALFWTWAGSFDLVNFDSLVNLYNDLLDGYDYEIINPEGYFYNPDCTHPNPEECFDWRMLLPFKALIVDEGLTERLMKYEEEYEWLTRYLESGGTIIYCGNLHRLNYPGLISSGEYYIKVYSPFAQSYFGIDSIIHIWPTYYVDITFPDPIWPLDSLTGFIRALPVQSEYPIMNVDTLKKQYDPDIVSYIWPYKSAPGVATFKTNDRGENLYLYESLYPQWSLFHDQPVGVKTTIDDCTTYLFGFHLWQMNTDDARSLINVIMENLPTGIGDDDNAPILPNQFTLGQNYPNPFNAATSIAYSIPTRTHVTLEIFNILGRKVRTLVNDTRPAGQHVVTWDGLNDHGEAVTSGIYLYRFKADNNIQTRKMIMLK